MIPIQIKSILYAAIFLCGIAVGGGVTALYYKSEISAVATKADLDKNSVLAANNVMLAANSKKLKLLEIEHEKTLNFIAAIPSPVRVRVPTCSVRATTPAASNKASGVVAAITGSDSTTTSLQASLDEFTKGVESDIIRLGSKPVAACTVVYGWANSLP